MRIRYAVEYAIIRAVAWIFEVLPAGLAGLLGVALGRSAWALGIRREVSLVNLRIALGADTPEKRLRETGRRSYAEIGRGLADFCRLRLFAGDGWKKSVVVEGEENLREASKDGNGIVFFTGHFGSWEITPVVLNGLGYPPSVVVRKIRNPLLDAFCARMRRESGVNLIGMENLAAASLRVLHDKGALGILPDQDFKDGVFADFFGVPASTGGGAAAFALRTGAPLVACFIMREDGAKHRIVIEPPIRLERTDDNQGDIERGTREITKVIEKWARLHPDRYFWLHKRWKTRPSGRIKDYTYDNIVGNSR